MRRVFTVCALILLLMMAGCSSDISDGPGTPTETSTEVLSETPTERPSETQTDTITETRNLSAEEWEYLNSTRWFGDTIGLNFDEHNHTSFHDYEGNPDNSVAIALQTDGVVPLERSIMDGAELIAGITYFHTAPDESRIQNGTVGPVHQPDSVRVEMYGPDESLIGRYDVDPAIARKYRTGNITVKQFAESVMDSYSAVKLYDKRGNRHPKYYLNRSELAVWMGAYEEELDESDNDFDKSIPTEELRANASRFEVLHEFEFSLEQYGQHVVSAEAAAYGSYWRTHATTFARSPERLNLYVHITDGDQDMTGHMDREHVRELVEDIRQNGLSRDALQHYQNQAEYTSIEKDETAFEDF